MAAAYAAIANRGIWSRPHIVDHVAGGGRPSLYHRRLVAPGIASQLMLMLKDVVAEGTGQYAAMPGYQGAGKTGTAQKPDSHGGYATRRYVASFVGIVRASRPRVVVLVTVAEPQGAISGGVVAAPAFQQIARFDLQYLEVPPDAPTRCAAPSRRARHTSVTPAPQTRHSFDRRLSVGGSGGPLLRACT